MKAVFLDTSALVKLYVPEAGSSQLRSFLADADHVAIGMVAVPEFASAVLRRHREGLLDAPDTSLLLASFESDRIRFSVGSLVDALALAARDLLRKHVSIPLRTLDALQLATALWFVRNRPMDWTLATSDRRMLAAAALESVHTYDPAAVAAP